MHLLYCLLAIDHKREKSVEIFNKYGQPKGFAIFVYFQALQCHVIKKSDTRRHLIHRDMYRPF
jgi:hypothetical protein